MDRSRVVLVLLTSFTNARDSKIYDFYKKIVVLVFYLNFIPKQHVLQLEISVDDSSVVAVVDGVRYLDHDLAALVLTQPAFFFHKFEQFPAAGVLHHHN